MRLGNAHPLWILLGLWTALPAHADVSVPQIQELVAEGHGGRQSLADVSGFHARGKILSVADGMNGRVDWEVSRQGDLRSVIEYPHRAEVRILAGRLAWNGGRRGQRPSTPDMTASMHLQYHRLVAPFELVEADPEELELTGESDEGWLRVLRAWSDDLRTTYEVDPDTGLIRRVVGEMGQGDATLTFVAESHDFRDVDGIRFPFRVTTRVSGSVAAETILDRLELRDGFEPGTFLPEGAAGDM